MPFEIPLLLNILQGLGLLLIIVAIASSILMTPKVVKYFVDSKIFIKSQQIKRLYDDDQNQFKLKYSDDHLLKHPNPQIARFAQYSDFTLRKMCIEQGIKDYNRMNKYDKIVALLKAQGVEIKEDKVETELFPETLTDLEPKKEEQEDDDTEVIEEETSDENEPDATETKEKKDIHPVKPTSIDLAKQKRRKELDKLSNVELNKIAGKLKIKYASKMRKAKLIEFIIDKEIEESVEAEGDAVKGFKQLEEGK